MGSELQMRSSAGCPQPYGRLAHLVARHASAAEAGGDTDHLFGERGDRGGGMRHTFMGWKVKGCCYFPPKVVAFNF